MILKIVWVEVYLMQHSSLCNNETNPGGRKNVQLITN
jgi:hypothetical protein